MKRKVLGSQDEYRTKKRRVPTNVAEAVELAEELLRSEDVSIQAVRSPGLPPIIGGDTTALGAMLDKAKARFAERKSVLTITVRRHKKKLTRSQKTTR